MNRDAVRIHDALLNRQRSPLKRRSLSKGQSSIPRLQRKESPPDKPLPSLPVASIRSRSPIVRRSLIDASERPLRKSLSPSPGVEVHEDWPAILPSRPTTPNTQQPFVPEGSLDTTAMSHKQCQNTVEAEENIDKATSKDKPFDGASGHFRRALRKAAVPHSEMVKEEERVTKAGETLNDTRMQDFSAGAVLVEHRGEPYQLRSIQQPRQTKTSMMRARLSSGSNHSQEKTRKPINQDSASHLLSSPHSPPSANANPSPLQLSIPGPVRSLSRTRRQVSAQNCPYGQGRRGPIRPVKPDVSASKLRASSQHQESFSRNEKSEPADLIAVKEATSSGMEPRRSLIPVRNQSTRTEPGDSEADILVKNPTKHGVCRNEKEDVEKAEDGDIDTDCGGSFVHHKAMPRDTNTRSATQYGLEETAKSAKSSTPISILQGHDIGSTTVIRGDIQPSTTTLSSTAVEEDEATSLDSPENSEILSLRDFAASEPSNYRVKRLSHAAPEHGPTLRIAEDAEKILFGADSEEEDAGGDLGAVRRSSTTDLRKSTVIKEQLKASKERIMKGPLSRSTTIHSLRKVDAESEQLSGNDHSAIDARTTGYFDLVGGSGLNASGIERSMHDTDPFVGHLPSEGPEAEQCLPRSSLQWPFRCAEAPPRNIKTVSERSSDGEDSWISPLATAVAQDKEDEATPTIKVPHNTPATTDVNSLHQASDGVPDIQTRLMAATRDRNAMHSTTSLEGQIRPPFPARVSSRAQFQEIIRDRNDKDGRLPNHQVDGPEIPNRFDSADTTIQPNAFAMAPVAVARSETVLRPDNGTSITGASSLRSLQAPDSTKAQLSSTKAMLSNFRGLFNKRSLENADALPTVTYNGSVRAKNVKVGKNGSPFPLISAPRHSKPLSTNHFRANARGTLTPVGLGNDRATEGAPSAFVTPVPEETRDAERLAMQVLNSAMLETNAQKKAKLGQVSCRPHDLRIVTDRKYNSLVSSWFRL